MLAARALRRMAQCSLNPAIVDSCNNHVALASTYSVDQATNIKWYEGGVSRRGSFVSCYLSFASHNVSVTDIQHTFPTVTRAANEGRHGPANRQRGSVSTRKS
jgi:hypothetical protein